MVISKCLVPIHLNEPLGMIFLRFPFLSLSVPWLSPSCHLLHLPCPAKIKQECESRKNYTAAHKTVTTFTLAPLFGPTKPLENRAANPINFCPSQRQALAKAGRPGERGGPPGPCRAQSPHSRGTGFKMGLGRLCQFSGTLPLPLTITPCLLYIQPLHSSVLCLQSLALPTCIQVPASLEAHCKLHLKWEDLITLSALGHLCLASVWH